MPATSSVTRARTALHGAVLALSGTDPELATAISTEAARHADAAYLRTLAANAELLTYLVKTARDTRAAHADWHPENRDRRVRVAVRRALGGKARTQFL